MKSADLQNVVVNHTPNPHSKNPGWEYFPSQQIKQLADAAKQKELVKPSPPPLKIKTFQIRAAYVDNKKPKHIFRKTDLKEIGKKKRESLQSWINEENDLRKGIQKPHKRKEVPPQKEQKNDEWPDVDENENQENPGEGENQEFAMQEDEEKVECPESGENGDNEGDGDNGNDDDIGPAEND